MVSLRKTPTMADSVTPCIARTLVNRSVSVCSSPYVTRLTALSIASSAEFRVALIEQILHRLVIDGLFYRVHDVN